MALYAAAVLTTATSSGVPLVEILAGASDRTRIMQILVGLTVAGSSPWGLGRPAATGTPSTSVTVVPYDPSDPAGRTVVATAWSVAPTAPTAYLKRAGHYSSLGGLGWLTFPSGLVLPVSSSVVMWSLSTVQTMDVSVLVDE